MKKDLNYYTHIFSFIQRFPNPVTSLISLGIENRSDEYYYDNNFRSINAYLFQYTLDGEGVLEIDGIPHTVKKNHGFFIGIPSNSRYYLPNIPNQHWSYIFILIESGALEEYYKKTIEISGNLFYLSPDSPLLSFIQERLVQARNGFISDFGSASSVAFEFMNKIYFTFAGEQRNYSNRIQRSINEMQNQFSNIEGSKALADHLNLSENHFIRAFKKEVGTTPTKYLNNIRLEHAKQLLLTSNDSVDEIAATCGYTRTNYFCRVFKSNTHMSPLEYRNFYGTK